MGLWELQCLFGWNAAELTHIVSQGLCEGVHRACEDPALQASEGRSAARVHAEASCLCPCSLCTCLGNSAGGGPGDLSVRAAQPVQGTGMQMRKQTPKSSRPLQGKLEAMTRQESEPGWGWGALLVQALSSIAGKTRTQKRRGWWWQKRAGLCWSPGEAQAACPTHLPSAPVSH